MGFLEYAWSVFVEKDDLNTKLLVSPKIKFPQLVRDNAGSVAILPEPEVVEKESEKKTVSLMGYTFPFDTEGKTWLASLFRAAAYHVGFHALFSKFGDYEGLTKGRDPRLSRFAVSVVEDVRANAYASLRYPERLVDLALANALALKRIRRLDSFVNPATKTMTGLLIDYNTGLAKIASGNECNAIINLASLLHRFRDRAFRSFAGENTTVEEEKLRIADEIYVTITDIGPTTIVPFLPHTEELDSKPVFNPSCLVDQDITSEAEFKKCLEFLGGTASSSEGPDEAKKLREVEACQVFDSWKHQKEKEESMIAKYQNMLASTGFRSLEVPEQDYTEFLRIRTRCKSEAHRLIESLLVARDALDEDPRKEYGVLDLQEIIQVVASKSPRQDVFMLDENLSKSYSWIILLDASKSMEYLKDFALEVVLILSDSANELLLDPASWGVYAFNDQFFILKDLKERYNARVKSRIGGLRFEGPTLLSDALKVAGQIIKSRAESMRLITVISDGYSYEYSDPDASLLETVRSLESRNISVIGIGAKSRKMTSLFKSGFSAYTPRDLAKKFSNLYLSASKVAAET